MRMYCAAAAVFAGLAWSAGGIDAGPTSAPTTGKSPSAAQKFVQDYYGKLITSVQKTPAADDDLTVAKQLLVHANDASTSEDLRVALAKAAIELTSAIQTPEATNLARQAVELIESVSPMSDLDKAVFRKAIADRRMARAVATHKTLSQQRPLALEAAVAHIAFAKLAKLHPGHIPEAEKSLRTVRSLVFRFRLTSLRDQMPEIEKLQRWFKSRQQAFQVARFRLAAAEKRKEAAAIQAAHRQLANAYLDYDGDLITGAKHLAAAGDPRGGDLAAAAAFQTDPKTFQTATAVKAAEALSQVAQDLTDLGRQKLAGCALQLCKRYLETAPAGPEAAKATLLVLHLEKLLGLTPDKKLLDRLAEAYGGLHCKLKIIDSQKVRVVYPFDSSGEFRDFTNPDGAWKISSGILGVKAGPVPVTTMNKLRFRADRPLRLSFLAKGKQHLEGRLVFYPTDATAPVAVWRCSYYQMNKSYRAPVSFIYPPDLRAVLRDPPVPRSRPVDCDIARMLSTKQYRIDMRWDGKGTVTWVINGKSVGSATYVLPEEYGYTSIRCGLATSNSKTYFAEVMMEGDVILDPRRPKKPQPPTTAPARPPTKTPPTSPVTRPVRRTKLRQKIPASARYTRLSPAG